MPNHCYNHLDIEGEYKDLIDLIEYSHKIDETTNNYKFCFEKMKPTPKDENGKITQDWYDWRYTNWGTKWDCYDEYGYFYGDDFCIKAGFEEFNENTIKNIKADDKSDAVYSLSYHTAWCPAMPIYDLLTEKYKDTNLKFKLSWYEGGCGFAGHKEIQHGEVIDDVDVDCCGDPVEYWTYLLDEDMEDDYYLYELIENHIQNGEYDGCGDLTNDELVNLVFDIFYDDQSTNKKKADLYVNGKDKYFIDTKSNKKCLKININ